MTRVLVTGGAGFIGSHVVDRLAERGDHVLVFDNFVTGLRKNLSSREHVEIVEGTTADAKAVDDVFDRFKPEIVVHAAGSYKDPDDWEEDIQTNVLGTAHVAAAAGRVDVRRLVYFQTALCYGTRPLERPITLSHPLRPSSSYAVTKVAGEQYIQLSGVDYVSFRIPNAYGPRGVAGPLAAFVSRLMAGQPYYVADARRDFIFIEDLIELVLKAIDGVGVSGCYHVASGNEHAISDLFNLTRSALGLPAESDVEVSPCSHDDVFSNLLDPSETNRRFAWRATTPLEVGVRRTVAYYTQHGVGGSYSHLGSVKRGGAGLQASSKEVPRS